MALFSNTSIDTWRLCGRKYFYAKVLKLRRAGNYAPFDDGGAVHAGLEAWYKTGDWQQALKAVRVFYQEKLGWNQYNKDGSEILWTVEKPIVLERVRYLQRMVCAYMKRYPVEEFDVRGAELKLMIPLGAYPTPDVPRCACGWDYPEAMQKGDELVENCPKCEAEIDYLIGTTDLLYEDSKGYVVADHKFVGKGGDRYLATFAQSGQLKQYAVLASKKTGEDVRRTQGNIIVKLKAIDKRGNPFHRTEITEHDTYDLAVFLKERQIDVLAIKHEKAMFEGGNELAFRRNHAACHGMFGPCPYLTLCHPARPEWWTIPEELEGDYEVNEYEWLKEGEVD